MGIKEAFMTKLPIWGDAIITHIVDTFHRFIEIVQSPFQYKEMLWILFPLLLVILLMELYFSRYKSEELGWNTAYGNSLVLIFVSLDLLRYLFTHGQFDFNTRTAIVVSIIFVGVMFTLLDFFHLLPKSLAFVISSRLPINFLALVGVIIVYTGFPIDFVTFSAFLLFLVILAAVLKFIQKIIPESFDLELD